MAGTFKEYANRLGTSGSIPDLTSDTIKVALIDTGTDDPNLETDDFWDDLSAASIGTPQTLTSKTWTYSGGLWTFDAADATFTSLTGNSVEELVIYWDTGTPSTSLLLWQFDSADVTNFAYTPDGTTLNIVWDSTGIAAL